MADFTALKNAIQNAIKQNGNEEITGNLLQEVLLAIVTTLGDGSINDLITSLGSEATTRGNADTTLQQNIDAEARARQLADSTLQGGINTAMQAINAINNAIANGCVYAGIATPSSTPASGKVFYLALTAGTYTNYGGLEVSQGINILKNNGSTWSLDSFLGIDDAPTPSSNKLVKSDGVFNDIMTNGSAFDLTAYNNGTTYADLNAALTALNALPAAYKKGGMSMKYVQTSDNKYEQYLCTAASFSTNPTDWVKMNLEEEVSQLGQKVLNPIDLGPLTGLQDANFNLELLLNQNSCDKSETEITTDISATINNSFLESNGQIVPNERGFKCRIYQITNAAIIKYQTAADYSSCAIFDEYPILNATGKIVFSAANTNTQGNIAVKAGQYIVVTYYSAALAFTRLFNVTYNFTKSPIKEIDGDSKTVTIKSVADVEYVMPKVNFDFTNNITANNDGSLAASYIDASTMKVISNANGWSIKYYHILEPGKYKYEYLANYGLVAVLDEIPTIGADIQRIISNGTGSDIGKAGVFSVNAGQYIAVSYYPGTALGTIDIFQGKPITGVKQEITITCSRYGVSGVDADYCGLNAIGDALADINDAGPEKIYNLLVRGHFLFTNPKLVEDGGDFKYYDDRMVSIFNGKDYCNIIGVDKEQTILEVRLSNDLQESDFPVINGQRVTFTDYQTCYIRTNSVCKNIQFVSTNCRYTVHLEIANGSATWDMLFENCEFLRNPGVKGYSGVVVFGLAPSCTLKFVDCKFVGQGNSSFVGGHSVLHNVSDKDSACRVIAENCDFIGSGNLIGVGTGTYNRQDVYSLINCRVSKWLDIELSDMSNRKRNLGTLPILNCDSLPIPYASSLANSYGLRVKAISGNGSSVRFNENSSAFNIVGNAEDLTKVYTDWGSIKILGYEYKDDATGNNAYAVSWVNCHPTGGNSLGSILGDCSINNKTLTIVINGVSYNIVFDQNYTSVDNDTILAEINAVIGSVAVADFFNPESFQYPHYKDVVYNCYNSQDTLISKGMGVVITGVSSAINSIQSVIIRKAKATDGHIDGIALDDIGSSQRGRIVQKGLLYCKENGNGYAYFSIYPSNLQISYGDKLSIDNNNDGQFVISSSAPVLKAISEDFVEII